MTPDFKVPDTEIHRRIASVQKGLQRSGMDGLFVVQPVDLFYLSAATSEAFLYVPAEGLPLLFAKQHLAALRMESPIETVTAIRSMDEIPGLITDIFGRPPAVLGLELDVLPVRIFEYYRRLFTARQYLDGSAVILDARKIKSEWEIAQMERTGRLFAETFAFAGETMRPGMTEMAVAGMMEAFAAARSPGARVRVRDIHTEGYPWHVLSGPSGGMVGLLDSPASGEGTSAAFPCGAGSRRLAAGEPIMIDFAYALNGYHMDVTRMFSIGPMPDRAKRACEAVMEIHDAVLDRVKPGVAVDALCRHASDRAESLGYAESYLGPPGYKVSFIGHGIGLELIEGPIIAARKTDRLVPGMIFALEPKMVFENAFAAGIESVFLVTDTGHRIISQVPVQIFTC